MPGLRDNAEREIKLKQSLFKKITVLIITAGMLLTSVACGSSDDDTTDDASQLGNSDKVSVNDASNTTIEMPYSTEFS